MCTEFGALKNELELLLVKNRGLTAQRPLAQQCKSSTAVSQDSTAASTPSTADSFVSYCSRSSAGSAAQSATGSNKADEVISNHAQPRRQPHTQLDSEVEMLLQQVDTVMGTSSMPSVSLPYTAASAVCTSQHIATSTLAPVCATQPQQQQQQHQKQKHAQDNFSMTADARYSRLPACKHDAGAETVSQSNTTPGLIRHQASSPAAEGALHQPASHASNAAPYLAESAVSVSRQVVSQPNNITILRAACSAQSPDSQPSAVPVPTAHAAAVTSAEAPGTTPAEVAVVATLPPNATQSGVTAAVHGTRAASLENAPEEAASPSQWHTNRLAQEDSQASISGSSTSHHQTAWPDLAGRQQAVPLSGQPAVTELSRQQATSLTGQHAVKKQPARPHSPGYAENIAPYWQGADIQGVQDTNR